MKVIMMNERLVNYLLILFSILVIIIVILKFVVIKGNPPSFSLDVTAISVSNMEREEIRLMDLIGKNKETYILVFKLNDCYSCIAKGLEDIQSLFSSGAGYVSIVIHDYVEDVRGFSKTFPNLVFHQISVADQYEHIRSPIFPVIVRIRNNKVLSYKFVTP